MEICVPPVLGNNGALSLLSMVLRNVTIRRREVPRYCRMGWFSRILFSIFELIM